MGICNASLKYSAEVVSIVRLWYHENMRIFHDRLIDDPDRELLKEMLVKKFGEFGLSKEEVLDQERILFVDFWHGRDVEPRNYVQIPDLLEMAKKMYEF